MLRTSPLLESLAVFTTSLADVDAALKSARAKIEKVLATPGAMKAVARGRRALADADPVVRAEWEGIDQLAVADWPRFAERRMVLERELARQKEMQDRGADANRKRHNDAEIRRKDHCSKARQILASDPHLTDAKLALAIFADLPDEKRKHQSPETIRKNIRGVGKAL